MKKYVEYLNEEIEFNLIPTNFEINKINYQNKDIDEYSFETINGNLYSIYFMLTEEDDELLPNKKHLSDYTDINKIPTIFFSLQDNNFDDTFDILTNRNEYLEVMGKVTYIIMEYISKHNYDVYTYNADKRRNNFYSYYRKHFHDFLKVYLPSKNYFEENGEKKIINYLIKDYQRYITESNYVVFSDGTRLVLPWTK